MPVRWIDAGKVSYLRSQSIYHGLGYAQTKETDNTIVLSTPASAYMCIGHFQDVTKEIDLDFCKAHNLPVIRRETGGGGVLIDAGQLFVQWVFQRGSLPRKVDQRFQVFIKPLAETYAFFGIKAAFYLVNDVHVNEKKIAGTGAATIGEAEVITGNFLFDFDTETMTRALRLPNELFRQQVREGLEKHLTTLRRELGAMPDRGEVMKVYKARCEDLLGVTFSNGGFTDPEIRAMDRMEKRLLEEDWLFSVKSPAGRERLVKIHADVWIGLMIQPVQGSEVEVLIRMNSNRIDFINLKANMQGESGVDLSGLEKQLTGALLTYNDVKERIQAYFDCRPFLNKVGINEWVHAVLRVAEEKQRVTGDG